MPPNDALAGQVRDLQVRILSDEKRLDEAYALASSAAVAPGASVGDLSRLGDVLQAMKRPSEAADAYGRAIAFARGQGIRTELWPLLLLEASALEEAKRWPEAKEALEQGLAIAPDQPLLLNFLGYAKLERGEDIDAAEAMIRKASELAPDDVSITDSLGWAQFKRGKVGEAIATLQKAAEKDPDQAEIQEHLGDALYKPGRRYEARFAWSAAMVTAEDEVADRVKAKFASGAIARQCSTLTAAREIAPAKLNLALHVRGRLPDGRHAIETAFAFCTDGDRLSAEDADTLSLEITGPFAGELDEADNLVLRSARALAEAAGVEKARRSRSKSGFRWLRESAVDLRIWRLRCDCYVYVEDRPELR